MSESKNSREIRTSASSEQGPDLLLLSTKKIGAVVSYVGTSYSGFAFQENQKTIAGDLLEAMQTCLAFRPRLTVAGRTDSGVHALGQVISFSLPSDLRFTPHRFVKSMNSLLSPEISVRLAWEASSDFDARFSARFRKYRYRFSFGSTPDPFLDPFCWRLSVPLKVESMREASSALLGEHDFSSFCRKDPNGASLVRRVDSIYFEESERCLDMWVVASSFCHQMVRSIAGLLYQVGSLEIEPNYVSEALAVRNRAWVKLLAPPRGLILWEVGYDEDVIPEWS